MIELIRTNDIVAISFAESVLRATGMACFVADSQISALEGGIGAFQRRLLVGASDAAQARRLLTDAGLGPELRDA